MISQIDNQAFISAIMDYLFILVFCLMGSIIKDAYNILTDKDYKVQIKKILISTVVSSILLFSFSDYLLDKMGWKMFILPCFLGGTVGFELMGKISNLKFLIKLLLNRKEALEDLTEEDEHKKEKHKSKKDTDIKDDG